MALHRREFYPVIVGANRHLVDSAQGCLPLALIDTQTKRTGIVIHPCLRVGWQRGPAAPATRLLQTRELRHDDHG